LEEGPDVPNHPDYPVLLYRQAVSRESEGKDSVFQERFAANGWRGIWRNGIFTYHHFHPDAHEALGIARGRVEVQLGGESGERLTLEAGDLVVLPAGTGHKNVSASNDLLVIGAYPAGQEDYSTSRTKMPRDAMRQVPRPQSDPFHGPDGPLLQLW
ncbi:MAG: cupin domain-containing protein, partial [Hyphomicrobiales bacterium]